MAQQECRSCHAPISWAVTTQGKRIPLDVRPVANGNLVLVYGGRGAPTAVPYCEGQHTGRPRFQSHFASCAHAGQHRRR